MLLAGEFPRDRLVQRELGATLYALGQIEAATAAFEAVVAVDPTDAAAYQFLSPLYAGAGRAASAARARALHLQWRDDPLAAGVGALFYSLNPQWADERQPSHTHDLSSTGRPVVTGRQAAPIN
jgi:Flp pilus assembly protein TadD